MASGSAAQRGEAVHGVGGQDDRAARLQDRDRQTDGRGIGCTDGLRHQRRATRKRSRPVRSAPVRTSSNPAAEASARTASACEGACSTTSAPPGASHSGAADDDDPDVVEAVGTGPQRLDSAPTARPPRGRCSSSVTYGGFDTITPTSPARSAGSGSNHEPSTSRTVPSSAAEAGAVGPRDRERTGRPLDAPDLGSGSFGRHRQGDGARARPEVDHRATDPGVLGEDGVDHHLGLGTRNEHPPVDEQLERAERPSFEHVLQRLTLLTPLDHQHASGDVTGWSPADRGRPAADHPRLARRSIGPRSPRCPDRRRSGGRRSRRAARPTTWCARRRGLRRGTRGRQ